MSNRLVQSDPTRLLARFFESCGFEYHKCQTGNVLFKEITREDKGIVNQRQNLWRE